jgi:RNA polymerase sigma factor (sigma-70 family)
MMTTEAMYTAEFNDAELVAESLGGNRDAFRRIVERYQTLISSLAYCATGNVSQSEDLAQETFVTAWKQLAELREPAKLRPWLCSITRFLISKEFRRQGREPVHAAESLEADEWVSPEPLPPDQVISEEEKAILWRSLERIPEIYREPLVLFYREHQSIEAVAQDLELSEDAVKQRLSRGRKLLQAQFLAFVAGALKQTIPGKTFTLGVLAALPLLATAAKAATAAAAGAAAAKGSATAKAATGVGALGAILTAGILWIFSMLASVGFLGICLGYLMSRALRQSARQREHVIRFWRTLAVAFPVFVIPTLLVDYLAPADALQRGFYHGMTLWLSLIYPLVLAALVIWTWQWWCGLPRRETDTMESDRASHRPLIRWLGLGMIVPACVLAIFLADLCSKTTFEHRFLSGAEAQKIITERKDARFSIEQYENGPRMLLIKLPEKSRLFGFYASANESTLALLAEKGITCPTHLYGRHFLGLPMPQQYLGLLSLFLFPAGLVVLLSRPRQLGSATSALAATPNGEPRRSRFYKMLLALRTEPVLRRTFCRVFTTVFLLVLGASVLSAFLTVQYYVGTARVKVVSADPPSLMEEFTAIQSERVLGAVVEKMDLNHRWRNTFGRGSDLNSSESLGLLRSFTEMRPVFNSNLIEIRVYGQDANEAAALANAIVEADLDYRNHDRLVVEVVAKALPGLTQVRQIGDGSSFFRRSAWANRWFFCRWQRSKLL